MVAFMRSIQDQASQNSNVDGIGAHKALLLDEELLAFYGFVCVCVGGAREKFSSFA